MKTEIPYTIRSLLVKVKLFRPNTKWAIYLDSKTNKFEILNSEGDTINDQFNNKDRYTRV